jgi:superfamily I DNA and/or RNA helicase
MKFHNLCEYYIDCLKNDDLKIIFSIIKNIDKYVILSEEIGLSKTYFLTSDKYVQFLKYNFGKELYVGFPCYYDGTDKIAPLFIFKTNMRNSSSSVVDFESGIMNVGSFKTLKIFSEIPHEFISNESLLDSLSNYESLKDFFKPFTASTKWMNSNLLIDKQRGTSEGIYNQTILFRGDSLLASYSRGLTQELIALSKFDGEKLKNTALHSILGFNRTEPTENFQINKKDLFEILPLNPEQEKAIENAFSNDISVITGPPGTGKSQIIASFIINASINGQSVLVASKNNKAVDVIEDRVNSLCGIPFMMRQGSGQYLQKLNNYFDMLLSITASENDFDIYDELKDEYDSLSNEIHAINELINETIRLRNTVDKKEREICHLRSKKALYDYAKSNDDSNKLIHNKESIRLLIRKIDISSSLFKKLIYFLLKKNKQKQYTELLQSIINIFHEIGISDYDENTTYSPYCINDYKHYINEYSQAIAACIKLQEYFSFLRKLEVSQDLLALYSKQREKHRDRIDCARRLWDKYLTVHYGNAGIKERQEMLDVKADISDAIQLDRHLIPFDKLIPLKDSLPCWAVTSLSAYGRIPMIPRFFDYVVIDEASQCDIASALPLLYRAKKAVIVGDPNQLRHISSIKPMIHRTLMNQHSIIHSRFSFLSSSLFDLASTVRKPLLIRNHYRCHPDIINFSNVYFYNGKLRTATDITSLKRLENYKEGITWIDVKGKTEQPKTGSAININEAENVIITLKSIISSGFTGSIGVVSPFRAQVNLLQTRIINDSFLNDEIIRNSIIIDTTHKFQGDEKDVIIFSPTISSGTPKSSLYFLNEQKNVFNVAITRAKANLLIVGDLNYCANCNVDFLKSFTNFISKPVTKLERTIISNTSNEVSSEIEDLFEELLVSTGIRAIRQYSECSYLLDFAIITQKRKLDIEVDGEMYHKDWNGETIIQDIIRDNILEVNGWEILRFWSYEILDNPGPCIKKIKDWIYNNKTRE